MNDQEFLRAFHESPLSADDFRHRGHLRLAWLVLRRHGLEEALQLLSLGIRQYAISKEAGGTYNETLTQFWITRREPCHTSAPFRSRIRTVHRHLSDSTGQTASIPSLATRNARGQPRAFCLAGTRFAATTVLNPGQTWTDSPSYEVCYNASTPIPPNHGGSILLPPVGPV